jgi:hypothetical protein
MGSIDRQIAVALINEATGAPLATIELPPEDLPESFALETTLHLGERKLDGTKFMSAVDPIHRSRDRSRSRMLRVRSVARSNSGVLASGRRASRPCPHTRSEQATG